MSRLDTSIFDRERTAEEARRAHKLENIYHAGQDKIWDGREVLKELFAKHGGVKMSLEAQRALAQVFAGLMWGELAAWKISAQLADGLGDFGAKLAATSQVHDEARHFYVLHDYLEHLDVEIPPLNRATRGMLELVLRTDSLVEKLIGMQLFVESIALTVFKTVRELKIDPVLTELLLYFERDEARHVGLGIQHTPDLVRGMSMYERVKLDVFQTKILLYALASLKVTEKSFRALGVDPRMIAEAGKSKMLENMALLAEVRGANVDEVAGPVVQRVVDATRELMFAPADGSHDTITARVREAAMTFTRPTYTPV
jgi:hypothetical protein